MHTASDPREIITPEAFAVAPELIGLPLGAPSRRAAAMAIDLVLVAVLANLGGILFGLAAAGMLWKLSSRASSDGIISRFWRRAVRGVAVLVLFAAAVSLWGAVEERVSGGDDEPTEPGEVQMTGSEGLITAAELLEFRSADTPEEAREIADEVADRLTAAGLEPDDVRDVLAGVAESAGDRPWITAAAESAAVRLAPAPTTAEPPRDSLIIAYAAAVAAHDSVRLVALGPPLAAALAADTVTRLEARIERLRERNQRLDEDVAEARARADEGPGLLATLRRFADDLGVGFGWAGLFFTFFPARWRGQTPGKRLLGLRVVRLDGEPIGWWTAFERFGGYAAGFTTGLLGFAQVLWDPNRQGIHDKITETVVIRA